MLQSNDVFSIALNDKEKACFVEIIVNCIAMNQRWSPVYSAFEAWHLFSYSSKSQKIFILSFAVIFIQFVILHVATLFVLTAAFMIGS